MGASLNINKIFIAIFIVNFIFILKIESKENIINNGVILKNNQGTINIKHKGNNYLEENPSTTIKKISKNFKNYDFELKGKIKVSKNFKPFRISIENEDPDDPSEWVYKETLNMKTPFYTLKSHIHTNLNYTANCTHAIYNRCTNYEKCNDINGYIYRIKITNITDFGEDIIFRNKVISSIKKTGEANRVLTAWDMGGAGEYTKLNKNIPLEEGIEKFKFKNTDFISLRHGESIILAIPYIAKKSGVYLPNLELDIRYAGAKGKLKIKLPKLIVPKLFGWVPLLYPQNFKVKFLSDMKKVKEEYHYLGVNWKLYDEKNQRIEKFSFSARKLSKNELKFIGKDYCRIFRNKLFALKGAKFQSKWLTKYFKTILNKQYKPSIPANKILLSQFTDIEKHNILLSLKVEQELND